MTETEWLAATDPDAMLSALTAARKIPERKLRLFAAACCRRVWGLLDDTRSQRAVQMAESYADGLATAVELAAAAADAHAAADDTRLDPRRRGLAIVIPGLYGSGTYVAADAAAHAAGAEAVTIDFLYVPAEAAAFAVLLASDKERAAQAALLRDLFGPLLFRDVSPDPSWLAWDNSSIVRLAAAVYEERLLPAGTLDATRLAVLADALEEAGCTDTELLEHLRGPGPHVRGCFVLDLLLGRE